LPKADLFGMLRFELRTLVKFLLIEVFFYRYLLFISFIIATVSVNRLSAAATCNYFYDSARHYTCDLKNVVTNNIDDTLEITGIHRAGHTDLDVVAVTLNGSSMSVLVSSILDKFRRLETLMLTNKKIEQIAPNAFQNCDELRRVQLDENLFNSIPSRLFQNCQNLQVVNLANSRNLTSIPEDIFGSVNSIQYIDMRSSKLSTLPVNIFRNLTNLRLVLIVI
jgi:BspA type Leucine rich repeat region (6 copies)